MLIIGITLCVSGAVIGYLYAATGRDVEINRLRTSLSVERAKRDLAERDLEFERMSNPAHVNWFDPKVEAGIDRILDEIKLQVLDEQLAEQNGRAARVSIDDVDMVIDLRDRKDGAA